MILTGLTKKDLDNHSSVSWWEDQLPHDKFGSRRARKEIGVKAVGLICARGCEQAGSRDLLEVSGFWQEGPSHLPRGVH